jgi:regulator of protease activity HflC (stomatin/prohibitin superfamily)
VNVADVLRGIATLSWIAAIAIVVLAVVRTSQGKTSRGASGLVIGALIFAALITSVSAGLVFIRPEERGVVLSAVAPGGYRPQALTPGLQWVIPFAETVVIYPISRQTYTMSIAPSEGQIAGDDSVAARTADGQEVLIDASIIFAIDVNRVIDVHINWQDRYANDLVRAVARGIIREHASRYGVEEIVSSKRDELTSGITDTLAANLESNGLVLSDFVLRNITFSAEYAASVEQKQIAEQLAQQAAFIVEQRRQEAEQARQVAEGQADAAVIAAQGRADSRIIEAQAEARALELIAEALRANPDLITYQYIQKLAPGIQVMLVPNDNPFLLPLPSLEQGGTPN